MSDVADGAGSGADAIEPPAAFPEWFAADEGERVEWVGEPAAVSLVPAAVWGVVLLPLLGLGLLVFASAYLDREHTDYVVTDETLYHKRGILSTNIESVGVDRIQNTEYTQSFAGAQLGYGTIEVSTAGSSGSDVTFRAIEQPRAVRDLITRVSRSGAGAGGTGSRTDTADEGTDEPAGGAADDLVRELADELRAVNESMANVERLLRERAGPDRTPPSSPGTSSGGGVGGTSGVGGAAGGGGTSDVGGGTELDDAEVPDQGGEILDEDDADDEDEWGGSGGSAADFVMDDDEA